MAASGGQRIAPSRQTKGGAPQPGGMNRRTGAAANPQTPGPADGDGRRRRNGRRRGKAGGFRVSGHQNHCGVKFRPVGVAAALALDSQWVGLAAGWRYLALAMTLAAVMRYQGCYPPGFRAAGAWPALECAPPGIPALRRASPFRIPRRTPALFAAPAAAACGPRAAPRR